MENDDALPTSARQLVEGEPDTPLDAPRSRRSFEITEVWAEGDRYIGLRVNVDDQFERAYERPGQYVTLSPESVDPRFLVIANAPKSPPANRWEFLVDRQTGLGQSMSPVTVGSTLSLSPPEGPGYPIDDVEGTPVICFTTGSGIASVRPAIQYWERHTDLAPSEITLYYGESAPNDFAYFDETTDWSRAGVRTFHCNGSLDTNDDGHKYVQHAFEADEPDLEDAIVFLAGAPIMKRAVVRRLLDSGVPLERIYTNV